MTRTHRTPLTLGLAAVALSLTTSAPAFAGPAQLAPLPAQLPTQSADTVSGIFGTPTLREAEAVKPEATQEAAPQPVTTPAPAPRAQAAPAAAAPKAAPQPAAKPADTGTMTAEEQQAWFRSYVAVVDPAGKGNWVLDTTGAFTSAGNRGNTQPQSYGKSRPTVYIYGLNFNADRVRNTMWHEAAHVLQVHDVGYSRSQELFGGVPGMESVAVCSEILHGYPRAGWGCTSRTMTLTQQLWAGQLS